MGGGGEGGRLSPHRRRVRAEQVPGSGASRGNSVGLARHMHEPRPQRRLQEVPQGGARPGSGDAGESPRVGSLAQVWPGSGGADGGMTHCQLDRLSTVAAPGPDF